LSWVRDLGELSATLSKTETALEATVGETPALAGEVAAARAALLGPSATELRAAAAALLTAARAPGLASAAALRAASGLYGASLLVRRLRSLLRLADGPARF
jgi:hypothetical protein